MPYSSYGAANDYAVGFGPGDTIDGGAGNDTIIAIGVGDTLIGGPGADVFVFPPGFADGAVITDWQAGDRLAFGVLVPGRFGTAVAGDELTARQAAGDLIFSGQADIVFVQVGANLDIFVDGRATNSISDELVMANHTAADFSASVFIARPPTPSEAPSMALHRIASSDQNDISGRLLLSGARWPGVVTYSLPAAGATWPGYGPGTAPFDASFHVPTALEAAGFRQMMQAWGEAYAHGLIETSDGPQSGEIRLAFSAAQFTTMPTPPNGSEQPRDGDIWLQNFIQDSDFSPNSTNSQYGMIMQRIGSALGLTALRFDLVSTYNSQRFTVMGNPIQDGVAWYVDTSSGTAVVRSHVVNPTTPMVLDDLALAQRFGAPTSAHVGDTTYSWSPDLPLMATVVDSTGVDTIDLTGHLRPSLIDLTPGAYSSIDYYPAVQQLADLSAAYPALRGDLERGFAQNFVYQWTQNLGIAVGTVIENVNAGSAADTIVGNAANNTIHGGAGDDSIGGGDGVNVLRGDDGNDIIVGGSGFDDINGNKGDDTISDTQGGDDWLVGGQGNDLISATSGGNILYGNLGNDTLHGGSGAEILRGGQGDDSITGGAGNDFISGDRGNDTVSGGAGADIFHTSIGAGIDRVTDFSLAEGDRVMVDPGTTYTVSQVGADTVIDMGNGDQMILVGVQASTLTGSWIFGA